MDKQPRIKLYSAVIDCADPDALAAFYAQLMDWLVVFSTEEYVVVGVPGTPQGGYPGLTFQRDPDYVPPVWPGKPGDQQTMEHLDFAVDDLPAAVARAGLDRDARPRGPSLLPAEHAGRDAERRLRAALTGHGAFA